MTVTFPLNLDITDETPFGDSVGSILQQIDSRMLIIGTGPPAGVQACNLSGVFYWDSTNQNMYICTTTDGTVGGTEWEQLIFSFTTATTTEPGLIEIALNSDVVTGTDNSKAVTALLLANNYAKHGANADITSLEGLTTPLSPTQGGTGLETPGTAKNILVSTGSGFESISLFGSGASQTVSGGTHDLTYTSATRTLFTGSPIFTLPAPNSSYDGFVFFFKNINSPGTGSATFNVVDGSNVEGNSTYTDAAFNSQGMPVTKIGLSQGAWWVGI